MGKSDAFYRYGHHNSWFSIPIGSNASRDASESSASLLLLVWLVLEYFWRIMTSRVSNVMELVAVSLISLNASEFSQEIISLRQRYTCEFLNSGLSLFAL